MEYLSRVELHCHSKYGGNAMMHAGEIIIAADKLSMPAIAVTDTSSIMAFPEVESVCNHGNYGVRPIYGMEAIVVGKEASKQHRISLLITGEEGKKSAYKILSECDFKETTPVFREDAFFNDRAGFLIGSGAVGSEVYEMALGGGTDDDLRSVISKYDYIELLPDKRYAEINIRLVKLCEEMNKYAVAVSDAHYLDDAGASAWKVLCNWNKTSADGDYHLYSTEEMLAAFEYLGKDKAYEIVVANSNIIAEKCGKLRIIPVDKQFPDKKDAGEILAKKCRGILADRYGDDRESEKMLDEELQALSNSRMEYVLLMLSNALQRAALKASDISVRGTGAGSLVANLMGISEVDPIKYKLPMEFIYGYDGTREIDMDINLPKNKRQEVIELIRNESGVENCVCCGIQHVLSDNLARAMIERYEQDNEIFFEQEKRDKICWKLVGNYVGHGKHPGGVLIMAENKDNCMPILKSADGVEITYFEYHFLDNQYLKLDLLSNDTLAMLYELSSESGVELADVPIECEDVLKLFQPDINGEYSGCTDLPEFKTPYVQNMMKMLEPKTKDDLIKISLLSHGTDCWLENGEILVEEGVTDINGIIACREDIFDYLYANGIARRLAFDIAEAVRKGIIKRGRKAVWNEWKLELKSHDIPDWYISSCEKIAYLFPRAHAVSYINMTMRMGWFKIHYPKLFQEVIAGHEDKKY